MKQHHIPPRGAPRGRRTAGHAQLDHLIDPYKARHKLPEPTRCPQCGAVFHEGKWRWMARPPAPAHEELCAACRRINDDYAAGVVTLKGPVVREQKAELLQLVRRQEKAEKEEHPLNRIMRVEEGGPDTLRITTTDIHLPRRIGEAIRHAFHGDLELHYDEDRYFVRVDWHRDT